jgi:hypothetical protein
MATTGAMTDYTEDAVLDEIFNKVAFSVSHTYISLYTATPADTGGASGTEVSAGGYARQLVYPNSSSSTPKWALAADTNTPAASKHVDNANTITYPQATNNWGSIKAFAVHNNSAGGTMIWYGVLDSTKAVSTGDTFKFDTSSLKITLR